jgi:hypothetical protein
MNASLGIHWPRVLLGGFLAEVLVIVLVLPLANLFGRSTLTYSAPAASLLACFLFAIWVGRRLNALFVLHGVLVGIVATLVYVALTRGAPEPPSYLFAHVLKLIGGAAGGYFVARRQQTAQQEGIPT